MVAILHLGDIHVRETRTNPVLTRADLIVSAIRTLVASASELYLVVSGDVAFAGKQTEYQLAADFFAALESGLRKLPPSFIGTVAVPGNHDCDFERAGDLRETIIAGIGPKLETLDVGGKTITELLSIQKSFFEFLATNNADLDSAPRLAWEVQLASKSKVAFRCLNTAWVSMQKEKAGQIFFPTQAIPAVDGDCDLAVTILHHPYGWLEPNNSRAVKRVLETSSDLILTGHEHDGDSYTKTISDGSSLNYVEGAALYDPEVRDNGFNVILLDRTALTYQVAQFFWADGLYEQQPITSGIFTRNRRLLEHQFQVNDAFRAYLDGIGTPFSHNAKTDLKLSDLFVYPDLRVTDIIAGKSDTIVRSSRLVQLVVDSPKLRISGQATSGRTSLAKTLYRELLEQKKIVPVLMNGDDFTNVTYDSVVGAITRRFKAQYSDKLWHRFSQLETTERILIIDDWQDFPLNLDGERLVLESLEQFGARLLLISDQAQVLHQIRQLAASAVFAQFVFAEIKPYGHVLRSDLITKWILLGREFQLDDLELTKAIDDAEHVLDTLVMTGIVPSFPLFVFSVLQARDQTSASNTTYGSFGHIYEQLLTRRLAPFGQKTVGAKLTLLSRVAYKMFSAGRNHVSEVEYDALEQAFTKEYAVSTAVAGWRKEFASAQILDFDQGDINFVYKYAYYFLLAWYFHDGISNAHEAVELKQQLLKMVDAAYDEVNTRTLIFYLYLSKDRDLIERLVSKAQALFSSFSLFDITKDLQFGNSLCTRHPKLLAPSGDHEANRKEFNQQKDDAVEAQPQALEDDDGDGRGRNFNIDEGFQLLEIMGQVVRNFPLELRADLKFKLTSESYFLALRIEKAFLQSIEEDYKSIVSSLLEYLRQRPRFRDKTERDITYASNMFLVSLVEGVTLGILKTLSFDVGVPDLRETYRQVREKAGEDDVSMRIIDVTITLDHFAKIPVADVEELKGYLKHNVIGFTVLRMLVGEYLSQFPCDYKVRQKMESFARFQPE